MAKNAGIGLSPVKSQAAQERRWRAESDLRTLKEAEQIKADRGRLTDAKRMAVVEVKALRRVSGKR